jgi:uncharacterized protein
MMQIVQDTNTIISGYLFGGNEYKLLEAIHEKKVTAYTSQEILKEIERVLKYQKLKISAEDQKKILKDFISKTKIVGNTQKIDVVKEDPADNKFIECAIEAKANYIVSGDKHLLNIKSYNKIRIIRTKELLELLT